MINILLLPGMMPSILKIHVLEKRVVRGQLTAHFAVMNSIYHSRCTPFYTFDIARYYIQSMIRISYMLRITQN